MTDRDESIGPLRRRGIDDIVLRGFSAGTKRAYIGAVASFSDFLAGSPDRAETADPGRYEVPMRKAGASATTMNAAVSPLRLFLDTTLGRGDAEPALPRPCPRPPRSSLVRHLPIQPACRNLLASAGVRQRSTKQTLAAAREQPHFGTLRCR